MGKINRKKAKKKKKPDRYWKPWLIIKTIDEENLQAKYSEKFIMVTVSLTCPKLGVGRAKGKAGWGLWGSQQLPHPRG